MIVYAFCTGSIELDRASMISDLAPGQRWTVPLALRRWSRALSEMSALTY
jgi:hypothetical protein